MIKRLKFLIKIQFVNIITLLILFPLSSIADNSITWDKNDNADYYVLYWGHSSGLYSKKLRIDISSDTQDIPLEISENGDTYYFSVKSVNVCGNSSYYSEEIETAHVPKSDIFADRVEDNYIPGKSSEGGCFIDSAARR